MLGRYAKTVPAAVASAIADAKHALGRLVRDRPAAAMKALDDLTSWAGALSGRLDAHDATHRRSTGCVAGSAGWAKSTKDGHFVDSPERPPAVDLRRRAARFPDDGYEAKPLGALVADVLGDIRADPHREGLIDSERRAPVDTP